MSLVFKVAALVLIFCVVVVCVSPLLDLDPTALRAARAALATMLALAALLVWSFADPLHADSSNLSFISHLTTLGHRPDGDLLDQTGLLLI